jgi:hypothetical protein
MTHCVTIEQLDHAGEVAERWRCQMVRSPQA